MSEYNVGDPEDLVECPYDDTHLIINKKFQKHLMDCGKSHPWIKLEKCRFNARHMLKPHLLRDHEKTCVDKCRIAKDIIFQQERLKNDYHGDLSVPDIDNGWDHPEPQENWDNGCENSKFMLLGKDNTNDIAATSVHDSSEKYLHDRRDGHVRQPNSLPFVLRLQEDLELPWDESFTRGPVEQESGSSRKVNRHGSSTTVPHFGVDHITDAKEEERERRADALKTKLQQQKKHRKVEKMKGFNATQKCAMGRGQAVIGARTSNLPGLGRGLGENPEPCFMITDDTDPIEILQALNRGRGSIHTGCSMKEVPSPIFLKNYAPGGLLQIASDTLKQPSYEDVKIDVDLKEAFPRNGQIPAAPHSFPMRGINGSENNMEIPRIAKGRGRGRGRTKIDSFDNEKLHQRVVHQPQVVLEDLQQQVLGPSEENLLFQDVEAEDCPYEYSDMRYSSVLPADIQIGCQTYDDSFEQDLVVQSCPVEHCRESSPHNQSSSGYDSYSSAPSPNKLDGNREKRKLEKKMREISNLETRQKNREKLNEDQLKKIAGKASIQAQCDVYTNVK